MKLVRIWVAVLALFASTLVLNVQQAPSASACSCVGYTFEEAVDHADLIAHIRVVRVLDNDDGYVSYRLAVERVWKGEHSNNIVMRTHEQTPACGLGRAQVGDSWRLWASGGEGEYSANWCMLPYDTSGSEMEDRLTAHLGEPAQMEPYVEGVGDSTSGFSVGPVATVIGMLMCIGVVVVLALNRRAGTSHRSGESDDDTPVGDIHP